MVKKVMSLCDQIWGVVLVKQGDCKCVAQMVLNVEAGSVMKFIKLIE